MIKSVKVKGYISGKSEDAYTPTFKRMEESFSGEMHDKIVKWPKELGAEHPFSFEECEKVFMKFGLLNGAMNKITDSIVGEFSVNCDNPNVQKLVDDFIEDNSFSVVLREWIREALIKGNGFMEVDVKEGKCRVLNANNIYVKRDNKGNVLEYNQWVGDLNKFNPASRKLINFKPNQIAHLKFNALPDAPYGLGLVWPNERVIENMILVEQDSHKLISRKAGAPIHVSVGQPGESVNPNDVDAFKASLQYMTNRTEWVTDGNVKMDVLQFGEVGKNLADQWNQDFRELIAGIDIPEVLMNSGQLNEGIANVQLEGFRSGIISKQDMIEPIILSKIIYPWLVVQGMKGEVDFVWNLPSPAEINARVEKVQSLLSMMNLSDNMRRMLELELGRLLDLPDAGEYLRQPEVGLDDKKEAERTNTGLGLMPEGKPVPESPPSQEKAREMNAPLPKIPGAKASASIHIHEHLDYNAMTVREFIDLREIKGFTYSDYLLAILKRLKVDKFSDLQAITEEDIANGLLTDNQVIKLRTILKGSFKRNLSMQDITSQIKESIPLKDRIYEKEDGTTVTLSAESRPELIARTETIRIANAGLKDLFIDNDVKMIRWIATYSDRTCDACMALDGQVIGINESFNSIEHGSVKTPPLHGNCRCSIISE